MAYLLKVAILPAILALVTCEFPIDEDYSDAWRNENNDLRYRLPENLDPIHYDIEITPYFEATGNKPAFSFDGVVTITVTAVQDGISELIVQENVREILGITVLDSNGVPLTVNVDLPFERVRELQFLKINLADGVTLVNGQTYVIRILYLGHMNETPLSRGMFRGDYVDDNGVTHWYAATHLQPTHSRQVFPSFDEPGFKSTFNIIVNRPLSYTETFSNMRLLSSTPLGTDRMREVFATTPKMSAYLVTIHISDGFQVIADNNDNQRSYRILARPNAVGQGDYALEVGPPLTTWLEEYMNFPYYSMGEQMKNDQIASPYWASGATENWGLVTYRELRLLYKEGETNAVDKMSIATITAHELAHKWFGNLVTARWWDNVWINEGYASYFEYFAMHAVDPTMELDDQFNIMYIQSALSADSSANTRALQHEVNSPSQVTGHFSGISYSKGAALLNMLKHLLTEDTFKKSLQYYVEDMQFQHAFPSDVFRAFERAVNDDGVLSGFPDVNITDFLDYWVHEPGYPLLTVEIDPGTGVMHLSQKRFYTSGTGSSDQVWPLPITFTSENSPNWDNTRATHVMTEQTLDINKEANEEWVVFNVKQNGLYRVNYDPQNWAKIAQALKENPDSIHYLNRAQIVDDVFALMRSDELPYQLGFQVLEFLKDETSYYVWYPAISGFTWLRNRFLHLPAVLADFDSIIFGFLETVISDLGYDVIAGEPLTRTLNRFYTLAFACNIGHEACIQDSLQKFNALVSNGESVNPNVRRHVYCSALREGGYEEWNLVHQLFLASNNQAAQVAMLRALGCTTDERAVQEYLEMALTSEVKAQDRVNAFSFLFMGDRYNARVALEFLKENTNEVREALLGTLNSVLQNMASYMDEEALQELESWLNENQADIPEYSVGISAVNSARTSMEWGTQRAQEIIGAARGSAGSLLPTTFLLVTSFVALLLKYLEMVLTSEVKPQDRVNAFSFLFMGDRYNARVALEFLKENTNEVREALLGTLNSVLQNMASYMDEEALQELESWLNENQADIPEYSVGISAVNSARTSMEWGTQRGQEIIEAARGSAGSLLPTTFLLVTSFVALLLK